jgi:hypothetical protein
MDAHISTEKLYLMNQIKLIGESIKEDEKIKKYSDADLKVLEVIELIDDFMSKNKELNKETLNSFSTLKKSYQEKHDSYNYLNFLNEKSILIKQKMIEKYLCKKDKIKAEPEKTPNCNIMSEYELIPSNPEAITIKDIIEICSNLIKFYDLQEENNEKKNKYILESYYVLDTVNLTNNQHNFKEEFEKHIDSIRLIKDQCEKVAISNIEIDQIDIDNCEKQIGMIKEEINKIFPKYEKLKEILQRNNLGKKKSKN